jgi:hypothetical protein
VWKAESFEKLTQSLGTLLRLISCASTKVWGPVLQVEAPHDLGQEIDFA